ncbi:hypothetical protein [Vibrio coralliilyticus]|uniref:hypothetical protein n=1 Tax=Vibrio coralliilyticus TaxID=190893 RepID=UPI001809081C|nr:hypothetical protein [Vibrio coralliilyticus]NUW69541.1 hypothetical protein [Vibrio coralliilyticus]
MKALINKPDGSIAELIDDKKNTNDSPFDPNTLFIHEGPIPDEVIHNMHRYQFKNGEWNYDDFRDLTFDDEKKEELIEEAKEYLFRIDSHIMGLLIDNQPIPEIIKENRKRCESRLLDLIPLWPEIKHLDFLHRGDNP